MSASEILAAIPKLSHAERRAIARRIFEVESEADILMECDQSATEGFKLLDALEAEDEKNTSR